MTFHEREKYSGTTGTRASPPPNLTPDHNLRVSLQAEPLQPPRSKSNPNFWVRGKQSSAQFAHTHLPPLRPGLRHVCAFSPHLRFFFHVCAQTSDFRSTCSLNIPVCLLYRTCFFCLNDFMKLEELRNHATFHWPKSNPDFSFNAPSLNGA